MCFLWIVAFEFHSIIMITCSKTHYVYIYTFKLIVLIISDTWGQEKRGAPHSKRNVGHPNDFMALERSNGPSMWMWCLSEVQTKSLLF